MTSREKPGREQSGLPREDKWGPDAADNTLDVLNGSAAIPVLQRLRNAHFHVLHDMCGDTNVSFFILCAFWLFDLVSLLILPLGPSPALPWVGGSQAIVGVWAVLGPLWLAPGAGEHLSIPHMSYVALYAILATLTACTLCLAVWLMKESDSNSSPRIPGWLTATLRAACRLCMHCLWVPIMINLFSAYNCRMGSQWYDTGLGCWSGGHVGMIITSSILLPCSLAWFGIVALTFIDREPDYSGKKNMLAAPHGRAEACMLFLKAALAAFFVFAENSMNAWGFLLPCLAAGLLWMYIYFRYLPYHNQWLNGTQVASASVFTSACVCGLLAAGLGPTSQGGQAGAVAWLLMLPLTIFTGWAVSSMHAGLYITGKNFKGHDLELSSPYAVELRVRAMLAEGIRTGVDPRLVVLNLKRYGKYGSWLQAAPGAGGGAHGKEASPDSTTAGRVRAAVDATADAAADSEALLEQATILRDDITALWHEATRTFGNAPILQTFQAVWESSVNKNTHMEAMVLKEGVRKADWSAFDVHFMAWSRALTHAEKADAAGASRMNVDRRLRFERLMVQSRAAVSSTRGQVLSFWTELSGKVPDLTKLQNLGASITASLHSADSVFRELLELAPANASIIRSYADFLLELANDSGKANELLSDAEAIEEESSKAHAQGDTLDMVFASIVREFDLSADSVGLMRVASDRQNLGDITSVNSATCRILGYSTRELLGKSVHDLVPAPIGAVHAAQMMRFLNNGETHFLMISRFTFFLHRGGWLVPVKVNVQPCANDICGVIEAVVAPPGEMYVWCLGEDAGWCITAMCETAMSVMCMEASSLRSASVPLSDYMTDPAVTLGEVLKKGAVTTTLTMPPSSLSDGKQAGQASGGPRRPGFAAFPSPSSSSSLTVIVKAQMIEMRQVGQPLWMLRLKRTSGQWGSAGNGVRSTTCDQGCMDEEGLSEAGSNEVQGSIVSADGDEDCRVPPKEAGRRDSIDVHKAKRTSTSDPSPTPTSSRPASNAPHAITDGMEFSACPMGYSSRTPTDASLDTQGRPLKSSMHQPHTPHAHANAHVKVNGADDDGAARHTEAEHAAFTASLQALEAQEGAVLHMTAGSEAKVGGESKEMVQETLQSEGEVSLPGSVPDAQPSTLPGPTPRASRTLRMRLPSSHMNSQPEGSEQEQEQEGGVRQPEAKSSATHDARRSSITSAINGGMSRVHVKKGLDTGDNEPSAKPAGSAVMFQEGSEPIKDKEGSVHSKGSRGSGTSATSLTEIVRRGVLNKTRRLESSLRTVRWAVMLTFGITAALNIASLLVTSSLMAQLKLNLILIGKNGRRLALFQRMTGSVLSYRLSAMGLDDPVNMVDARARNGVYLDEFDGINRDLYSKVDGSLAVEHNLYTNSSAIQVREFSGTPWATAASDELLNYTVRDVSLANAVVEFSSRMRRVLSLAPADILLANPNGDPYWIMMNGINSLATAMNESLIIANMRSDTQGDTIKLVDTIVLCVAEVVCLLVICATILPAVLKVSRSRNAVFDTFIQVPLPIIRALRTVSQKRIDALARANEEAEVGLDIGGKGNEIGGEDGEDEEGGVDGRGELKKLLSQARDGMRTTAKSSRNARVGKFAAELDADDDEDDDVVIDLRAAVNTSANTAKRTIHKKRGHRRGGSDSVLLFAAFIWPVVLYMAYFAIIWWYKASEINFSEMSTAELLYSAQVEVNSLRVANRIRYANGFCDDAAIEKHLGIASSSVQFSEALVDALLYGSKGYNTRPGLQAGPADYVKIWQSDACQENSDWYYTVASCNTFYNGIMTQGLLGAFRAFSELARKLINKRHALIGMPPGTCSLGFLNQSGSDELLLSQLGRSYLAQSFSRVAEFQLDSALEHIASFEVTYTTVVGITVAAILGFWLVIYAPMIAYLDRDIKNVRLLLLLFPDEVARSVPVIVAAGRELLNEAGGDGGSVISSGHSVIRR